MFSTNFYAFYNVFPSFFFPRHLIACNKLVNIAYLMFTRFTHYRPEIQSYLVSNYGSFAFRALIINEFNTENEAKKKIKIKLFLHVNSMSEK